MGDGCWFSPYELRFSWFIICHVILDCILDIGNIMRLCTLYTLRNGGVFVSANNKLDWVPATFSNTSSVGCDSKVSSVFKAFGTPFKSVSPVLCWGASLWARGDSVLQVFGIPSRIRFMPCMAGEVRPGVHSNFRGLLSRAFPSLQSSPWSLALFSPLARNLGL